MKWGTSVVAAVTTLLVISGCKNPTLAAFEMAAAELPAAEAEAKRLGLPLTGADLMPESTLSTQENANTILQLAYAEWKASPARAKGTEPQLTLALANPDSKNLAVARRILEGARSELDLAVKSTQKSQIDFARSWDKERIYEMKFPELGYIKSFVKWLGYRAFLRTLEGDTRGAVRDLQAAFRLSHFAGSDPTAISALVQFSCETIVIRAIERVITLRPSDASFLTALDQMTEAQLALKTDIHRSLRGEVVYASIFTNLPISMLKLEPMAPTNSDDPLARSDLAEFRKNLAPNGVGNKIAEDAYRAQVLKMWSALYDPTLRDLSLIEKSDRMSKIVSIYIREDDPTATMTRFLSEPMAKIFDMLLRREVWLHTLKGLIVVNKYRATHGRFPDSLADAGFQAQDVFSGEPLRYIRDGKSVRVYSIGPDRIDNGGTDRIEVNGNVNEVQRDCVCMYPRAMIAMKP